MKNYGKIQLLIQARKLIKSGKESFICVALLHIQTTHNSKHSLYLRKWIRHQLNEHTFLNTWVQQKIGPQKYWKNPHRINKMRNTRLAWIDWMISELKK